MEEYKYEDMYDDLDDFIPPVVNLPDPLPVQSEFGRL
jgi:hypothetical protein